MPHTLQDLLAQPIRWHDAATSPALLGLLHDMQANILKGHGRDHTGNIFVSFRGMTPDAVAALLRKLAPLVTTALEQLRKADAYRSTHLDGGRVVCVFLARGAYQRLGTTRPGSPPTGRSAPGCAPAASSRPCHSPGCRPFPA